MNDVFSPFFRTVCAVITCFSVLEAGARVLPVIPQPVPGRQGPESYELEIAADGSAKITAPDKAGEFWATVTYAQLKAQGAARPGLKISDGPKYRVRGFMLDVARKFYPMDFLRDLVRTMSWYKLNEFHIHLNENSAGGLPAAFRLECSTYPGLQSKDGFYTKDEFRAFVKWARTLGVNVVPEFDSPAHVGAFTRYDKSLASKKGENFFDLSSPEPVRFMERLFAEYLGGGDPVFAGPDFSVGTDEYEGGDAEQFRAYTAKMFDIVRSYGKKPRAWGALGQAAGSTRVDPSDVTLDIWNNGYYHPRAAMADGFNVISIPDNLVYIVPGAGYYYDRLNCRRLYERWEPCDFDGFKTSPDNPKLLGGKFALWNDVGEKGSLLSGAWERILPALQTLGQKMWSGAVADQDWQAFRELAWKLPGPEGIVREERLEKLYLEVDLADGSRRWHDRAPATGWETEDFVKRMVFRRVTASPGAIYYVAVSETTQGQYRALTGDNPSADDEPSRPVDHVNFHEACAFVSRLNALSGGGFAIPTGEEWETASREYALRGIEGGVREWTVDPWNGDEEIRMMRDGKKKPSPSRAASRTGSSRDGFRVIYRPPDQDSFTSPALLARPQQAGRAYGEFYMRRHYWFTRHKAECGEGAVVFIGDSITEGLAGSKAWKERFSGKATEFKGFNIGYDGDRTENVIWRISNGQLDGYRAKAVVLMIGTNNIANRYRLEDIVKGVERILDLISEKQPGVPVLLQAVFPRSRKADDALRLRVRDFNGLLARLAASRNIRLLDFGPEFLAADGTLTKEVMYDALHPAARGYEIWMNALLPELRRVLK